MSRRFVDKKKIAYTFQTAMGFEDEGEEIFPQPGTCLFDASGNEFLVCPDKPSYKNWTIVRLRKGKDKDFPLGDYLEIKEKLPDIHPEEKL